MKDTMYKRRSIRSYTDQPVTREQMNAVLEAGLLAPSGRNLTPWQFVLVDDRETLQKLSRAKAGGSGLLAEAAFAIAIVVDERITDVWVEDASVAMTYMLLQAQEMDLGNCWVQIRLRFADKGETVSSEEVVRKALEIPEPLRVDCILSVGQGRENRPAKTPADLQWEKVHYNRLGKPWER